MNKKSAKNNVMVMVLISLIILTVVFVIAFIKNKNNMKMQEESSKNGNYIIQLNEIQVLMDSDTILAKEKLNALICDLRKEEDITEKGNQGVLIFSYIFCVSVILVIYIFVYIIILRPFDELEEYAEAIASGNLEQDFKYKRVNMFGKFTWAFDHMRGEILRARRNEQAAIENNKTVIATLSHDIKTPIASIRGYAEGLTMNMDKNPERRARYADVIMKKCDEVTKITDDLFIHSLHDLNHLVLEKEDVAIHEVIAETIKDFFSDDSVKLNGIIEKAFVKNADRNRISQVIGNIISNAKKYASDSDIVIETKIHTDNTYELMIRDFGEGIKDEDLPFIFDKFYRGKNVGNASGAGLGLFIVKYIMEQFGGRVEVQNDKGLVVRLFFPI